MKQKAQTVFQRYEKKYLLSDSQLEAFMQGMQPYVKPDEYARYTICSLYYDTDSYELARASLEKPQYKEKLRLRSYGVPRAGDPVFLELKKKFDGVVYKRRAEMSLEESSAYFHRRGQDGQGQIMREIGYFTDLYPVKPKAFIAYDRTAFCGIEDSELRITFDKNVRWRASALELSMGDWGAPLLPPGKILMEIKIPGAAPLWLSRLLAELKIYPGSFSKYGQCYKEHLIHDFLRKGVHVCA